jgi:signal transduction histidine kinase
MQDLTRRLLGNAREAVSVQAFWDCAAATLRVWTGSTKIVLHYQGLREKGVVTTDGVSTGAPRRARWSDESGRTADVELYGPRPDLPAADLDAALELAGGLAPMVGRRALLEHDQRLGNFSIELSRWLLAAPERDLMLRYTLQSVMKLFDAEGAYAALREPGSDALRVVVALGRAAELDGMLIPLEQSTTGRVVRTGEALITGNIREEPDIYLPPTALSAALARAAMLAPLQSATGVLGAIGLIRYRRGGADVQPPPPFTVADLHFFLGVAAHVAAGLELSHVVRTTRATADRAVAMVEASPLPLVLVDLDGRVHLINEAGRRVFGLEDANAVVGTPLDTLGISSAKGDLPTVLAGARGGGPWHGRVVVAQPSGDRRLCDCTVTDLQGLGSTDMLLALYDRTEELRAQREMVAREKLATIGEIASGVAHEVNNPLAAIRMEAELLGMQAPAPEVAAASQAIIREVDRAARIAKSLLRLATQSHGRMELTAIGQVLQDIVNVRAPLARESGIELRITVQDELPAVLSRGGDVEQIFLNLLTNAEDAVRGRAPGVIALSIERSPEGVRVCVDDTGPGVARELRTRIFDPFFTTKPPDKGNGLGLAMCLRIVSELGGKIWVEDGPLGGARFVVELPTPIR